MRKEEVIAFLKEHKPYFVNEYGVIKLGLFGSYALDQAREDSDIDLVIEMKSEHKFRNFFALRHYLEAQLKKEIDLGIEHTLKSVIRESIQGKVIYV